MIVLQHILLRRLVPKIYWPPGGGRERDTYISTFIIALRPLDDLFSISYLLIMLQWKPVNMKYISICIMTL